MVAVRRNKKFQPLQLVHVLVLVALCVACRETPPARSDAAGSGVVSKPFRSAATIAALDASADSAAVASGSNSDKTVTSDPREQAWRDLIIAADSDMHRPIDASVEDGGVAAKQYAKIAAVARGREAPANPSSAVEQVAYALATAESGDTLAAVSRWILNRQAERKHRTLALANLQMSPNVHSPTLLDMYSAILSEELWGSVVIDPIGRTGLPIGAFWVQRSGYCVALGALSQMDRPETRAVIERIANDKSRTGPNPRTLAVLTCDDGEKRDEFVAQGLASERLIALALLQDKDLLMTVAADPTEPQFLRKWVKMILSGTSYWKRPKSVIHDDGPNPDYAAPCKERWNN